MNTRIAVRAWRTTVALCVFSFGLFAQLTSDGTLVGTVTDKSGGVLPSAAVKIVSNGTGLTREVATNSEGRYRVDLLPAGVYKVTITAAGFAVQEFAGVGLAVSQTTTLNASLDVGAQKQEVNVESSGAPIEMAKTDISTPITTEQLQDLPLNGRDFVNLAFLAPGARPVNSYDPTKNRVGVFGVDGSSGRNVNVTVNGIDDKDNTVGGPVMQLPLEAVEEFKISTQRFSAANGRSEGAAISAITKSGTNEFHGSLYLFDRNEALNATDYFTKQGGGTKPPYSRQQFGGSIGGPVRKNKDFLFFTLERTREATSIVENPSLYTQLVLAEPLGAKPSQTIATPYFDWRYNGRWDHTINDKNNFFVSYTNQNNNGQNDQSTGTSDLTAGNFTTNQLILASANLNSVITPNIVNAVTIGYQYWNNLIDSKIRAPTVTFSGSGESFGTNGNVPQQSFQKKWQFKDDLSITHGNHSFKMGFDWLKEPTLGGFFESNPTPAVTFGADPSTILGNPAMYPQGFATPGLITNISESSGNPFYLQHVNMFGVYFQDDWKVSSRLTLNLGLRWDKDFGLVAGPQEAQARAFIDLKAIGSSYGGATPHDDNKDFSPRVGFAYDLTGRGKHVIRGGFGLYYGQIFQNITLFMLQQTNPTIFGQVLNLNSVGPGDANADPVPGTNLLLSQYRYGIDPIPAVPPPTTVLAAGATGRLIDPLYRNPYTEQFNVGYSWQLSENSVIEADYSHVLGLHESKSVQINPKSPNFSGRLLTPAFTAAGVPALGSITDFAPIGRSRYDGLSIAYRRRLSKHFSLNTSYLLSKALAYNGSAANFSQAATDPSNIFAAHDFGPAPSDERHRWVTSGLVSLPWGIKFAPIMQWASARPYSAKQGLDYFGVGNSSTTDFAVLLNSAPTNYTATASYTAAALRACIAAATCHISSFDSQRGSPFFQLDARFSKLFRFRERTTLEFMFQAFNLTNRANFGGDYQTNITSKTFGTPIGFIAPSSVIIPQAFTGEAGFTLRF